MKIEPKTHAPHFTRITLNVEVNGMDYDAEIRADWGWDGNFQGAEIQNVKPCPPDGVEIEVDRRIWNAFDEAFNG